MIQICACGCLIQNSKILLGKRAANRTFYPNVWDIIGGHCNENETPEEALVREIKEELGVTATQIEPFCTLSEPNQTLYGAYEYHVFKVMKWEGIPRSIQVREHSEIRWCSLAEALQLQLAHPQYPIVFRCLLT